jgi:hypothetical protein
MFISSVVGATANIFHKFQASRVIGGFGMASFEILVQCTIGDLYFVARELHGLLSGIFAVSVALMPGFSSQVT